MKEVALVFRIILPDDSRAGLIREAITDAIVLETQALGIDSAGVVSRVEDLDEDEGEDHGEES